MKKHSYRRLLIICLAVCLLSGCKKKPPEAPLSYDVGGDSVPSLNETVGEDSGQLEEIENIGEKDAPTGAVYTYTLPGPGGQVVADYIATLTQEESGFQVVDETGVATQTPDFTMEEGAVRLAKASAQEKMLMQMDVAWGPEGCVVTVAQVEGTLAVDGEIEPMTARDAVNFLNSLPPSLLGLDAQNMREYNVYFLEGEAMVNKIPCVQLRVYRSNNGEGGNSLAGMYLLSGDQKKLFRMFQGENEVLEITLP